MKRYAKDGTEDANGEFVRWEDVERRVEIAAENAIRMEFLRDALVRIATVPVGLPNAQAAVRFAGEALEDADKRVGEFRARFAEFAGALDSHLQRPLKGRNEA